MTVAPAIAGRWPESTAITLATTDKVKVYGSTANLSFNLFGQETT